MWKRAESRQGISSEDVTLPCDAAAALHDYDIVNAVCVCCRERMKLPYMSEQCEQMLKITNELVRLEISYEEYLCMKVLLLLSTGAFTRLNIKSHFGPFGGCLFQSGVSHPYWFTRSQSKTLSGGNTVI